MCCAITDSGIHWKPSRRRNSRWASATMNETDTPSCSRHIIRLSQARTQPRSQQWVRKEGAGPESRPEAICVTVFARPRPPARFVEAASLLTCNLGHSRCTATCGPSLQRWMHHRARDKQRAIRVTKGRAKRTPPTGTSKWPTSALSTAKSLHLAAAVRNAALSKPGPRPHRHRVGVRD